MELNFAFVSYLVIILLEVTVGDVIYQPLQDQCVPSDVMALPPVIYSALSLPICGIICQKKRCLYFLFTEKGCEIHCEGMANGQNPITYYESTHGDPIAGVPNNEVAKGKVAYMSPNTQYTAELVVDDDTVSYQETLGASTLWFMIDLGAFYYIHRVTVLPRPGYFGYRFQQTEILLGGLFHTDGDTTSYDSYATYQGPYDTAMGRLEFNHTEGVCGRFLVIQQDVYVDGAYAIADVEAFARAYP